MAAARVSLWLVVVGTLAGCGRSGVRLDTAVEAGGAEQAGPGAQSGGAGGVGGTGTSGGTAMRGGAGGRAGSETGGVAGRPVIHQLISPALRLPQNGHATGSVWVERSRRPRFVWDAQPGMSFELEIDDSCEVGAIQTCGFPSPEWRSEHLANEFTLPAGLPVNEQEPVGRRYYWRVRTCVTQGCSPWSMVRYVDVGRQLSDFDGDGYADVVLSNEGNSALRGRVLIGFGPTPSRRSTILEAATTLETPDHFGALAKPIGDLDGDGFADLLVTAPGDQTSTPGRAYVFFGATRFFDAASRERLVLESSGAGNRLVSVAIPAGDVDADGMQDFVIDSHPSEPRLFRGRGRGVSTTEIPVVRSGEVLYGLSAGDVTGDGYSDLLAFSVIVNSEYPARYDLLRGSVTGLAAPTTLTDGGAFASAQWNIVGDVNGDGFADLAHTVNDLEEPLASHVEVSMGAPVPSLDPAIHWAAGLAPTDEYLELMAPLAAGDVNGDGVEDSLLPLSFHLSELVQANLYLGGRGSRSAPDAVFSFQSGSVLFVSTAFPSAPGDVNGDGYDDVFLSEDYGHTGKLFVGGTQADNAPDDELELPFL